MSGLKTGHRAGRALVVMVLILLLVAMLGARGLNADTYWYDEWWSLHVTGGDTRTPRSIPEIITQTDDPLGLPTYYMVLSGWGALVGWSEAAVRALSLLAGVLAVAVVYRLAREFASRQAGLYAALALGSSAFFASYLHEARMYTLVALLSALSLWAYWRVTRKPTVSRLVMLYAVLVALLYAHYAAAVVPLSIGLYHLIRVSRTRRWLIVLLVIGAAGLTYLPWLGTTLGALTRVSADPSRQFVSPDIPTAVSNLLYLFSNGCIALLVIFAVYSLSDAQRRASGVRMVWVTGVCALVLALLINERIHFLSNTRYLLVLFPLLALIAGMGAARTKLAPLMMAIWVGAGLWVTFVPGSIVYEWVTVLPWNTVADELRERAQPGDALVYLLPDGTPNWVHDPVARYYLRDVPVTPYMLESLPDETPAQYDAQLGVVDDALHFWIGFDPQHRHSALAESAVQRLAGKGYRACEPAVHRDDTTLQLYAQSNEVAFDYRFGDGVTPGIALGLIEPPDVVASSLRLLLLASVDPAVARGEYSVALHVENGDGQLVAQTDFGLPDGCYAAQIDSLPPGMYRVLLTVYRWQTGERLAGENAATGEQGDRLVVGSFTIGEPASN